MRTCIHLGMYLSRREAGLPASVIQRRRKLFWTVYSLERNVSIALGYPVSLPDRLIDVELPVMTGDGGEEDQRLQQAVFIFQLRRIESRIHHSIYRNDRTLEQLLPKTAWHYQQLQEWKQSIVSSMSPYPESSGRNEPNRLDYLLLHYHRAIRLLIQPFLSILPCSNPYYKACLESAGQICQLHKGLHQNSDYGHSFIAVQTVFVSGVMLLYCLWIHGSDVWSIRLSNHLRACSSVLFVMGERTPWVRRYRDAFEALVAVTMARLEMQQGGNDGNSLSMHDTTAAPQNAQMRDAPVGVTGHFPAMNECPPGDPMPMPPPLQVLQDRWMEFDTMAVVNDLVNWTGPAMPSGQTPCMDYGNFGNTWEEWQLP